MYWFFSDSLAIIGPCFVIQSYRGRWKWKWNSLSRVRLFVTPWTVQSMEFSRPAFPFPSRSSPPRNCTGCPALQADSLPTELWGKPVVVIRNAHKYSHMPPPRCKVKLSFPSSLRLSTASWLGLANKKVCRNDDCHFQKHDCQCDARQRPLLSAMRTGEAYAEI